MRSLAFASLALLALPALAAPASPAQVALAERIVVDVAAVKEGEVVFVVGDVQDLPLLQELFLAVAKHGGLPMMRVGDQKLDRRWFDAVPAKYDRNAALLEEKLVALPDVILQLDRRDVTTMKDVPPARRAAFGDAFSGLTDKAFKRGTRQIFLGNGLFPTKDSAKAVGVSEGDLKKLFEAGLAVDAKAMATTGEAVRTALPAGKEITIETPAGTSLKLKLTAKPLAVSDGLISAAEVKSGGTALMSWLPAGEIYGLVAPGSAEGKIVVPRFTHDGEDIKDLTVTVAAGKVTAVTAKASKAFDAWKALYDAAGTGKDMVGVFDIGLNPAVKQKGKAIMNFVPAGTVTVMAGGDEWAGGTNKLSYANAFFLHDATVKVGDAVVVDKGELKVPAPK